jgi:hypothetical protein
MSSRYRGSAELPGVDPFLLEHAPEVLGQPAHQIFVRQPAVAVLAPAGAPGIPLAYPPDSPPSINPADLMVRRTERKISSKGGKTAIWVFKRVLHSFLYRASLFSKFAPIVPEYRPRNSSLLLISGMSIAKSMCFSEVKNHKRAPGRLQECAARRREPACSIGWRGFAVGSWLMSSPPKRSHRKRR